GGRVDRDLTLRPQLPIVRTRRLWGDRHEARKAPYAEFDVGRRTSGDQPPGAVQAEQKSAVGPLSGGQVVSPQGGANAGYPDGIGDHYGQVIVNMEGDPFLGSGPVTFCYDIYVYGTRSPRPPGSPRPLISTSGALVRTGLSSRNSRPRSRAGAATP